MSGIRKRIEKRFESLAKLICRWRWLTIVIMAALVASLASGLPRLTVDTSNEGLVHKDDPILKGYHAFRDQFGQGKNIIIAIESDEVFSQKFLEKLKALHHDLEENVPHIHNITSMVNARNIHGEEAPFKLCRGHT
ncbi:MAG: hypothetical protein J7L53_00905 [Deltaproteobacteria bacterium]|nr:hypothetical protein [Deltaproteobacteria bacterium]